MPHDTRGRYKNYGLLDADGYYDFRRTAADGDQVIGKAIHDVIDQNPGMLILSEMDYNQFSLMAQSNSVLKQFRVPRFRAKFFQGHPWLNEAKNDAIVADVVEAHFSVIERNYGYDAVVKMYAKNLAKVVNNISKVKKQRR